MSTVFDIELLRTFHAVARLGRFRAAAEHVNKSPAAVSLHIQRLEAIAGGRLLERDNQSVTLTVLGRRLLSSTDALLAEHDRVVEEIKGKRLTGRVVLGIPDEYAAHVIRDIVPGFAASWPDVILEVKTAPSYKLRDQVARGRLDIAIYVQPAHRSRSPDVLMLTTPVWVGSPTLRLDDSCPVPLALYAEPCPYRAAMTSALEAAARKWKVVLDSGSTHVIKACVESGLAVTLIDRARVTAGMRVIDGLPLIAEHEVVLTRPNTRRASEITDLLAAALRQQFRL
ncbi:LysR family transcriptional regulator [Caballeronia sp. AZ10_KS36]|uniref:LysR family transcriptional regulator n=1 Tax=Caballeronia sp. AZ10_KS36 TaxID=2921757 RepID=UPI00202887E0|nr:LysR family transcriptional regulator [Caballeronia sp. AZ10_KS36]